MKNNVIPFDTIDRLIQKARRYTESPELYLEEQEQAHPLLMKVLQFADHEMRIKIVLLLGFFAREKIASFLVEFLVNDDEDDDFKNFVAVQLSRIIPELREPQPFIDTLLSFLSSDDPEIRVHAATALAWENNFQAAIPLIELLFDPDTEVQQCAVYCLSKLGDDRIFPLMADRLKNGTEEQKKCILFNLWHFGSKRDQCMSIYLDYLDHSDPEFRLDALALMRMISDPGEHIHIYHKCLNDDDPRIRALAVEHLEEVTAEERAGFRKRLKQLVSDSSPDVRRAAVNILKMEGCA